MHADQPRMSHCTESLITSTQDGRSSLHILWHWHPFARAAFPSLLHIFGGAGHVCVSLKHNQGRRVSLLNHSAERKAKQRTDDTLLDVEHFVVQAVNNALHF